MVGVTPPPVPPAKGLSPRGRSEASNASKIMPAPPEYGPTTINPGSAPFPVTKLTCATAGLMPSVEKNTFIVPFPVVVPLLWVHSTQTW